ncbi:hypothetical protein JYU34_002963 [Plutella xylostella]|uniref:Uncharacterized protein n=1 Tax=Plutella xylostella TaxID=51655 RepID=A0ABQ7R3P3_PLUXY|nr:hypothetical protein JYU34_002963 [Plutella xylostella]
MASADTTDPYMKKGRSSPPALTARRPSGNNLPAKNSTYVYVNEAYSGELSSRGDLRTIQVEQPTGVVREQYWACAKWPRAQKFLAIAVAVLFGAVIGLVVSLVLKGRPALIVDFTRNSEA